MKTNSWDKFELDHFGQRIPMSKLMPKGSPSRFLPVFDTLEELMTWDPDAKEYIEKVYVVSEEDGE